MKTFSSSIKLVCRFLPPLEMEKKLIVLEIARELLKMYTILCGVTGISKLAAFTLIACESKTDCHENVQQLN